MTRAARETGVSRPMISQLERGQRRPSGSLAEALIAGYGMKGFDAEAVRSIALPLVGRDSPLKTGVIPAEAVSETSWDTQGNGTRRGDGAGRHRADSGTDRVTGRAAPAATADDWIAWARRQAEAARQSSG